MSDSSPAPTGISTDWARTLVDEESFRTEQRRLANTWTFLGFTGDVARNGDWFRASVASRSVFVQRFDDELRGFENVCPHRFYPLRTSAAGNGPVICGFHHWQFNRDGRAAGIPICKLLYGKSPTEVGAYLGTLEIATCGHLIFGRFPSSEASDTLQEFLGDLFPVLEAMAGAVTKPDYLESEVAANWRLYLHISLDDYHAVAVHPSTFGRGGYPNSLVRHRYVRFGQHSALLHSDDSDCLANLLRGCRDGDYRSRHYFVMQLLPNLVVSHVEADRGFWFCAIIQLMPVAHDKTVLRAWSYPAPFEATTPWIGRATRPIADVFRKRIFRYFFKRVLNEDARVCEHIQSVAHQIDTAPIVGGLEERIKWFEDALRRLSDKSSR